MMQNQYGNRSGKSFFRKWQRGRIALQHRSVCRLGSPSNPQRKCVTVLEARHSPRAFPQFFRRRARPRANLKNMLAQFRARTKAKAAVASASCAASTTKHKTSSRTDSQNTSDPLRGKGCRRLLKHKPLFQDLIIAGLCDIWLLQLLIGASGGFAAEKRQIGRRCTRKDFRAGGKVR